MQLLGDRYRLAEPLGTGGMSVVWRGYDELLGRLVAIKVLARNSADVESFAGRIRQEAMASARITHPNIAGVYDYGEATDSDGVQVPYMVMELVEGRSLAHRLQDGPLPWRQAVRTGAEVAAALVAAHEMGLAHRDISPANVLLAPTGAKVIDFGISAPVGVPEAKSMRLGTPAFIAPERFASGGTVHPAADVYALGVLLYQSLTASLPWPAESISQLLSQQRYAAPQPLPPVPDLPPRVVELIGRCLARQPEQRPTSALMARQLAAAVGLRVAVAVPTDAPIGRTDRSPAQTRMLIVGQRPAPGVPVLVAPPPTQATPPPRPMPVAPAPLLRTMPAPRRTRRPRHLALIGVASVAMMGLGAGVDLVSENAGAASRTANTAAGSAPASPSPAAPATAAGCAVSYHIRSMWNAGFTADVQLTNTGTADVSTWTLTFAMTGNQQVLAGWNGVFGQTGPDVTVADAGYNARIHPGATTTVGFNGSYQEQNPSPVQFRLNGVPCSVRTR